MVGAGGMECRVTASAKNGHYRIVTEYLTDPSSNAVVMNGGIVEVANAFGEGVP